MANYLNRVKSRIKKTFMSTEETLENNSAEIENPTINEAEIANEAEQSASSTDNQSEKITELNEKYLRLYSEFENFRRRTAKEKLDLLKTASGDVIKQLLPVVDDLERAIKYNENATDIEAVKEGFTLVYNKMKATLEQQGLKEMEAINQPFDVEIHEALTKIPAPTEDLKGKVVDVMEKGFLLNEKVIRYAKVIVGE